MSDIVVIPRPGEIRESQPPIQAPSEAAFVETFGQLLPPASYLQTPIGRAAYYELLPPSSSAEPGTCSDSEISRVVLVHGVQTPALGLQPLASTLKSKFPNAHIVLIDLWGHGLTDTPIVAHDPSLFHSLLDSLLVHLKWDNAHFLGYSFGGSTVATFAAAYPHRVASFVLVAAAGLKRASRFDEVGSGYMRSGDDVSEEKVQEWVLDTLEGGPLIVSPDWEARVARGEVVAEAIKDWEIKHHRGHMASVVGIFRDGGVFDRQDQFIEAAKTGIRNICVVGEWDDWCTKTDLQEVGFRDVVVVPAVGHGVVRERVPEVAGFIEGFWKSL
ncbi:hypothetical protein TMatcc_006239 [Talaromyces marneffei ATCC 18224]|uniref:Valacyclovir hydrolase, putative n=2 Tax=Talaromyces marneffei TaxID=37727 RepID=B6QBX1_TALMQ|nr:uncharacterized protein EYB26_002804 [Talaromyces marneffei]EEA25531.1 valacyclovir hydrolase, putative [Talaromyces marneffei ATCC 18224]KAE8554253.1 hypothetical protein EYB25_002791 [Talaromyces marneffei]QGA15148.1 hypothetical protein EYB26_002804 [Talaromyces marneffei]